MNQAYLLAAISVLSACGPTRIEISKETLDSLPLCTVNARKQLLTLVWASMDVSEKGGSLSVHRGWRGSRGPLVHEEVFPMGTMCKRRQVCAAELDLARKVRQGDKLSVCFCIYYDEPPQKRNQCMEETCAVCSWP